MAFGQAVLGWLVSASVRSIVLAALALVIVLAFRIRGAAARHAIATSVLAGMLLMTALQPVLPRIAVAILKADPPVIWEWPAAREMPATIKVNQFDGSIEHIQPVWRPTARDAVAAVYAAVSLILLIRLLFSYLFTRRLVRGSRAIKEQLGATPVYESDWISAPLTVGWLRPKILLPAAWRDWSREKLNSVLAHERTHIRRGDWAIALAASVNRCLFWFHPLPFWIERTLASLAEEACDDAAVLEVDTVSYAEALLDMAAAVKTAQGRLNWEAMAMAKASEVTKRIERILDNTRQTPTGFTRKRWLVLAACAVPLVYVAAVVEPVPVRAQQAPMGELLRQGRQLAPGEVGMMEQYLTTHPHDLDARTKLITYYYANGLRQPRIDHIMWLIANHPESQAAIFTSRGLTAHSTTLNDAGDYMRAAELWKQQAAAHADDARVLGNAAEFLSLPGGQLEEAERLLIAASSLEPNRLWTERLVKLYVSAILADTGDRYFTGANSSFAAHVRTLLETSKDGDLVTVVGFALTSVAKRPEPGHQLPPGVLDLNEHPLLMSAVQFGERVLDRFSMPGVVGSVPAGMPPPPPPPPANRVRGGVVGGVPGGIPGGVQGAVMGGIIGGVQVDGPPPPPPPSGPTRIKVGGQVQAYNLIRKVAPVYPEEAKAAGIDGNVVLNVTIAEDGHMESAEPTEGHPLLAAAAVEAVLQWKYKPTLLNGSPVKVLTTVTVPFQK